MVLERQLQEVTFSMAKTASTKFYAIRNGRRRGIFSTWVEVASLVKGYPNAQYKSFKTEEEALKFLNERPRNTSPLRTTSNSPTSRAIVVYTDGSTSYNGYASACAGYGVYFGPGDPRNIAGRLSGSLQTNQRAELTAVIAVLNHFSKDSDNVPPRVVIRTDSKYTINCLEVWHHKWVKARWTSSTGKPVLNKDLIRNALHLLETLETKGCKVRFEWVKGHSGNIGNDGADLLAVTGAQMPSV